MTMESAAADAWRDAELRLRAGDLERAAPALERALTLSPNAIGFRNLAVIRLQLKQPELAINACDAALTLVPLDHEAHGLRGDILFALEKFNEAIESYRTAVRLCPTFAQAWSNLSVALRRVDELDTALEASETAFTLDPNRPAFAIQRGLLLVQAKRYAAGREALESVLKRVAPTFEIAQSLFAACHLLNDQISALHWLNIASTLKPNDSGTEYNRGIILTALGKLDDALLAYQKSSSLDPTNPEPEWNAALLLLRTGRWEQAWPRFEARLRRANHKDYGAAINAIPRWTGHAASGKQRILLLAEQGLGDTLMFCRYASLVAARGFDVAILAQAPLRSILNRMKGISQVCDESLNPNDFDYRIEFMSLPGLFNTRPNSIPFASEPYLQADHARLNSWRDQLQTLNRPRIGLMWRGRKNPWLAERSVDLTVLAQHLPKEASYISLQKQLRPEELAVAKQIGLETHNGHEVDFEDAAAIIAWSDLIVTIDTSITHLAGGLGAKTLVLLPDSPDWRWGDSDDRSGWYPNVKLFRLRPTEPWNGFAVELGDFTQA